MRLFEEYFDRNNINVLVVKQVASGSLLFKTRDQWNVMILTQINSDVHPSFYKVEYFHPVHDGNVTGTFFEKISSVDLESDEYEDYFFEFLNDDNKNFVNDKKEVTLAIWEIFVIIYDGWICQQDSEFKLYVDRALNEETLKERYSAYQDCYVYLTARHPNILRAWKYELLGHFNGYLYWMANLVRKRLNTVNEN